MIMKKKLSYNNLKQENNSYAICINSVSFTAFSIGNKTFTLFLGRGKKFSHGTNPSPPHPLKSQNDSLLCVCEIHRNGEHDDLHDLKMVCDATIQAINAEVF